MSTVTAIVASRSWETACALSVFHTPLTSFEGRIEHVMVVCTLFLVVYLSLQDGVVQGVGIDCL